VVHVLVVEDDQRLARLIKRVLEEELHVVDLAYDGSDALYKGEDGAFDVIILDVMLPEMDGVAVCRRLREAGVHTPVLMLTARDAVEDRVRGLDAGADDYLPKPFAFAELLARLRALTRRRAPVAGQVLAVADLTLDPVRRRVERGGRTIDLTPKEFALLEYLMRHPNQILTRTQIMDHVWSYEFSTLTNVVDLYIHYLRRKVDAGFRQRLIRTARGVGYGIEG
jgi:DNA-binding response OmpR family regulator